MRIEAEALSRSFGPVHALDGLSFTVEAYRKVALIGPNGSGKSTLNRILMGLLAYEGSVRLAGRCPFRERVRVARELAYVPQIAPQLGASVAEVVRAVTQVRGIGLERVSEIARVLELPLAQVASRPFRALSGGMKQKVLIALAFAAGASLLVLDEPTGSLDARARERFYDLFAGLAAETTLVLCSHRLDEIRPLVDHVLLLNEGRLAYDGPLEAFLARCARATLEVRASEAGHAWLRAHGFTATATGVWLRVVDVSEKMKLLPEIIAALGPALLNLNARDLEALDLTGGSRGERDD